MDAEIESLIKLNEELVALLEKNEAKGWSAYFQVSLQALKNSDAYGCQRILEAYGGMGSFNDLILQKVSEDGQVHVPQEDNDTLKRLANEIYELAKKLWREQNASN